MVESKAGRRNRALGRTMVFDQRRITMKRVAGLLALVLVASLLGTSDVHGGFGGGPAGETNRAFATPTNRLKFTGTPPRTPGQRESAFKLQRARAKTGDIFIS